MFGKRITLFKLFGFEVRLDVSWIFIALLVTWSLAQGFFPRYYEGLESSTYWWMGIAGAIGLFLSIIVHEFSHSLIARKFGLPMKGITLFIFGGVAEMEEEPPNPKAEFFMAISGPITSIIIGFMFYFLKLAGEAHNWPVIATASFKYLSWINWILAGFNLLPAFPLDGGRVLRSVLWHFKKNIKWATNISSQIGSGFGLFLTFLGILYIITGFFVVGIWYFLIGLFLRNASQTSYRRLVIKRTLEGEKVSRFMKENPVTAPASVSVKELVENYVYKHHFKMYPVVNNGRLVGRVTTQDIKKINHDKWENRNVLEITRPCSGENTVSPDEDVTKALSIMNKTSNSRLMVVWDNKLVGIITLKDLLRFLSIKLDLEGEDDGRAG